jgi:tetratricopeptide (TPR) repeat protein
MRIGWVVVVALFLPSIVAAQSARGMKNDANNTVVVGPTNLPLFEGAQALLAGDAEEGVRLTLRGLKVAQGAREHETGLSNLCAGYLMMAQYKSALLYCDMLLARNDKNWRAYNNRAVIYIKTSQYDMAERDLARGEALRPGAHTLKVARAMYMDAVSPVSPEVEVDDRQIRTGDGSEAQ